MRVLVPLVLLTLAAGCLGGSAPEIAPTPEDSETKEGGVAPIEAQFTGTATGTPAAPFEEAFPVSVPRGAVAILGNLTYDKPPVDVPLGLAETLSFMLVDPDGEVVDDGYTDVDGRIVVASIEPPRAGDWQFIVRSETAVNTPFTIDTIVVLLVPEDNTIVKSLELRTFYEVNLIMEEGSTFSFSYNASAPIAWDIHSHPPEGLKEWDTGEGASGGASFTAPSRDVFSILWENTAALPTQLSFEVKGKFLTHSHSG